MVAQLRGGILEYSENGTWVIQTDHYEDIFRPALVDVAEWLGWKVHEYNQQCRTNPAEVERRLRDTP